MAKELKVSVITVKRAYEELEHDGVIVTIHGRGCYVCDVDTKSVKKINTKTLSGKIDEIKNFSMAAGFTKEEVIVIINKIFDGGNNDE